MIEVLEQALEALENVTEDYVKNRQYKHNKAIEALRQAIAELESQEPVALQMDVIVVNLVREGINKHRARELAEHFIKHTHPLQPAKPIPCANHCEAKAFEIVIKNLQGEIERLKAPQRTEQEPVAWTSDDMAYRPSGLPQDFVKHEVESVHDWSDWVCPNPEQYFMKCCDCGLVHEMQFKVAKYKLGNECEFVEDTNLQAVFKAQRTHPPQRTEPLIGCVNHDCLKCKERTWVGLTKEQLATTDWSADFRAGALWAEANLKEKNS